MIRETKFVLFSEDTNAPSVGKITLSFFELFKQLFFF